jgi:hypothetical protein
MPEQESNKDVERRYFLGKNDPTKLMLENIFPYGDIIVSSPVAEVGKRLQVIVQGNETILSFLESQIEFLFSRGKRTKMNKLGQWTDVVPFEEDAGLKVFFKPGSQPIASIVPLVLLFRLDLVMSCDLKLAPFSRMIGQKDDVVFLDQVIPLPHDVKNGSIEIPAPIIKPKSTENLTKFN